MKRFFSALLCAAALTGTLAVPMTGAVSTDTTLRVGLTVSGGCCEHRYHASCRSDGRRRVLVRHAHAGKCLR